MSIFFCLNPEQHTHSADADARDSEAVLKYLKNYPFFLHVPNSNRYMTIASNHFNFVTSRMVTVLRWKEPLLINVLSSFHFIINFSFSASDTESCIIYC